MFPAGAESCPWDAHRVEAECCVQDVPRGQSAPADGGAGTFGPGVRSQSCCVLGVTKLPNSDVQRTLAGAAIRSKDMCPVSRAADFGGDARLSSPG